MRKERGITLIALIITIIVMLILTGVTINVAINGGLLGKAEKATFQTKVRQIQEALQIKKAILLADNIGTLGNTYSISLDELDIDQKLKEEFSEKLSIDENADLCYHEDKVTEKEKQWLIELGIKKAEGSQYTGDFEADVRAIVDNNADDYSYNYVEIYDKIKTEYPTAAIITKANTSRGGIILEDGAIFYEGSKSWQPAKNTINMLKDDYENPETVAITSEIETKIKEKLGETIWKNLNDTSTVQTVITELEEMIEESDDHMYYIAIKDEKKLLIGNSGVTNYVPEIEETIILTGAEANNFEYELTTNGDESPLSKVVTITKYNGNNTIIQIPRVIVKNNGDAVFVTSVSQNALATTKPVKLELTTTLLENLAQTNFEKSYSELTTAEIMTAFGLTPDENTTYQNTIEEKTTILIENYLIPSGKITLSEGETIDEYIEKVGEGDEQLVYGYVTNFQDPIFHNGTKEEYVESIDEVIISEGIYILGDNIVSGNYISDLYLPTSLRKQGVTSNTALSGAMIRNIRTRLTYDELKEFKKSVSGSQENILGSGIDAEDFEFITD